MATRAIRYDKLEFDSVKKDNEVLQWVYYNHNDSVINVPLQEACAHQISYGGDSAQDFATKINNMRNQMHYTPNYYQVINQFYGYMMTHLLEQEIDHHGLASFMRDKMIEMRDYAKAHATKHPHYGHIHFDHHQNQPYMDMYYELSQEMTKVANALNEKYFPNPNVHGGYFNIVASQVSYSVINPETTDDHIDSWCDMTTGNWGHLWRTNTYTLLRGGHGRECAIHTYPTIPSDIMEGIMEKIVEEQPVLALRIASHAQMFSDNPHAKSMGHSWTSRNRSNDCWFKVEADQVSKRHTTVFAPPQMLFGKHTPKLAEMVEHISLFKADVITFLEDSKPILKQKTDAQDALRNQTANEVEQAMVKVIQGLLNNPDTVDIGTAIIGNIAGIAQLPVDTSNTALFPNGYISYTYHDYEMGEDRVAYLYPHHLSEAVNLSAFNLTDEVQEVLWKAYQENLQSMRDNHANRCAQLARQIAQTTTRHDAEMQVVTEAFAAYQTKV